MMKSKSLGCNLSKLLSKPFSSAPPPPSPPPPPHHHHQQLVLEAIQSAVESHKFHLLPDLFYSLATTKPNSLLHHPNPFSFLSSYSPTLLLHTLRPLLRSLLPLRPRSLSFPTLHHLLHLLLLPPHRHLLPLSLPVLHHVLLSGIAPCPHTHLSLSRAYLQRRLPPSSILSLTRCLGFSPSLPTCNYLLLSLSLSYAPWTELLSLLRALPHPDPQSYAVVVSAACRLRRTPDAVRLIHEMVDGLGLVPRRGTVAAAIAALRADRDVVQAAELVEWLGSKGIDVGFESYEMTVEGLVERGELLLAGNVVMDMTARGLIPYLKTRRRVVEGLASIGEGELACAVRQRLAQLKS